MDAGMIGADPRVLREMAARFDAASQQLMATRGAVQTWVDRRDVWQGLDNQQFTNSWETSGAVAVTGAATTLQRCADILRANADAQDTASAADGAGFAGSGLFSTGVGSPDGVIAQGYSQGGAPAYWDEFLIASNELIGHESLFGWTVGELTNALGGLGLTTAPGAALSIALAAPKFAQIVADPTASSTDLIGYVGKVAIDLGSGGLMSLGIQKGNPAIALAGAAFMTTGMAVEAAQKADFSSQGFAAAWDYVKENPMSLVEETGKATVQVLTDVGKKTGIAALAGVFGR